MRTAKLLGWVKLENIASAKFACGKDGVGKDAAGRAGVFDVVEHLFNFWVRTQVTGNGFVFARQFT